MSAFSMPSRPGSEELRPVAWRRMAWVIWRQHRLAGAGVLAFLGALTLWIWRAGLQVHHAYAAAVTCDQGPSGACDSVTAAFNRSNSFLAHGYPLAAVPALIGAFIGAPLLAREFETGTYRFTWSQSIGRTRWTLAKLVSLAFAIAASAGAFSMLLFWYYEPYLHSRNAALGLLQISPLDGRAFGLRGLTFAAWTVFAFAIGGLAGALVRRIVPAIIATLATYAALTVATVLFLRQHYQAALVGRIQSIPASAWTLDQWGSHNGKIAFTGLPPLSLLQRLCSAPPTAGTSKLESAAQCLSKHGYTFSAHYQPAERFWTFQWIESGWLLLASAVLIALTIWVIRRRAA
jgi:hypothetical protein